MRLFRFVSFGCLSIAFLYAQEPGARLILIPAEPLTQPRFPAEQLKQPGKALRSSKLELKPSTDPVFIVEEGEFDGEEWRTFRRPKVDRFSRDSAGAGAQGFDLISFFEGRPEKGSRTLAVTYEDATWWFATVDHKRMFLADPARYVPEYGGFCAYSIAKGYPAPGDPRAWTIDGGKLYLFFNGSAKAVWQQDQRTFLNRADRNWPKMIRH